MRTEHPTNNWLITTARFFPKLTYLGATSGRTWVIDIPQLTWRFGKKL